MGLIPVKLGETHASVLYTHIGGAFQLSPSSRPELAPEPHDIVDIAAYGNHFNVADLPDDLKVHPTNP